MIKFKELKSIIKCFEKDLYPSSDINDSRYCIKFFYIKENEHLEDSKKSIFIFTKYMLFKFSNADVQKVRNEIYKEYKVLLEENKQYYKPIKENTLIEEDLDSDLIIILKNYMISNKLDLFDVIDTHLINEYNNKDYRIMYYKNENYEQYIPFRRDIIDIFLKSKNKELNHKLMNLGFVEEIKKFTFHYMCKDVLTNSSFMLLPLISVDSKFLKEINKED